MTTYVHTHFHPRRTGVTSHVEDIVLALQRMGRHSVALGEALREDVPQIGRRELEEKLQRGEQIVWHSHRPKSLREGLRLRSRWPQMRVVWTHHSWRSPSWTTRRLIKQADAIVCLTQEGARQFDFESTVIGHGVCLERLQPASSVRGNTIGMIGRIRPDKGHQALVEAFCRHAESAREWDLRFYGETRPQHRRFARSLTKRCPEKLTLHGFNEDRVAMYEALDLVVMASPAEGYSLVVPEALAMGLPVLSSRLPHFDRCLKENEGVAFFDAEVPGSLDSQLERLLLDSDYRERLRSGARESAEKHFSIKTEAAHLAEVYDSVLMRP